MSVFRRSHLVSIAKAKDAEERTDLRKRNDLVVKAIGDGSDYTAFQDLAGISTLSVEFGDEDEGDQYHSIYDDFYWYTHFSDTDFSYGRALAQTAGTAMMRLADANLIPFDYSPQAEAIAKYEDRAGEATKKQTGRIQRAQSGIAGRRLCGDGRPAQTIRASAGRGCSAVFELRSHEKCD